MSVKTVPATAKQVRVWFDQNPRKVPTGAEKSVKVTSRGRIKPEAVEVFNKAAKSHGMKYTEGSEPMMPLSYKAKNHRMVTTHLPKREVRALAGKPNSRGPLSESDLAHAAEAYVSLL